MTQVDAAKGAAKGAAKAIEDDGFRKTDPETLLRSDIKMMNCQKSEFKGRLLVV